MMIWGNWGKSITWKLRKFCTPRRLLSLLERGSTEHFPCHRSTGDLWLSGVAWRWGPTTAKKVLTRRLVDHRRFAGSLVLLVLLSVMSACSPHPPQDPTLHRLQGHLQQIAEELAPLDFNRQTIRTLAFQAYYKYYDLDFAQTRHVFGTFRSGNYLLAAQVFYPEQPRGTLFLLHGYLDHTGVLTHLIQYGLEQQFVVAVYDLPGHGLSTGTRASIASFSEYAAVFDDFVQLCEAHVPRPYRLISHSTGSAIALEYFVQSPTPHRFQDLVFLAPLVRYTNWHLSKIAYTLGKPLGVETVPRLVRQTSCDQVFLEFLRHDPLQISRVPLEWVGALFAWNARMQEITPLSLAVLVIQGTDDRIVDWEYNIPFLQEKLVGMTVQWIEHARHQLANETPFFRTRVFQSITTYFEQGGQASTRIGGEPGERKTNP
ncbi:alpha/beta fold hydrolase [candidate division KSB3 bacterium]|uniref:Alpha/beta fold hydrolase n=1 Tax=candidate division KSB3 bacterium TaxID=2044937 RepID=A0A9D5JSE8_9BACT|nr:alpha/beta fold hydrolase [candidate division KSB3 bacterium]MBD3323403.1 alpha/beta fold hydrolase [candidate division KSB3 bacterium]